jgi:ABC-2 type transport system permease protein
VAISVSLAIYVFVQPTLHSPLLAIYYIFISSMMLALLGCLAGIIAQSFDQMAAITNYVITPLSFLSGTFYSIDHLPAFWQKVAHLDPFFYMIDGFRYAMTGYSDSPVELGMTVMLGITLMLWFTVQALFTNGWRLKS